MAEARECGAREDEVHAGVRWPSAVCVESAASLRGWTPRRSGVTVKNEFRQLQVSAVDDDAEEDIAAVNDEANDGIVRVT